MPHVSLLKTLAPPLTDMPFSLPLDVRIPPTHRKKKKTTDVWQCVLKQIEKAPRPKQSAASGGVAAARAPRAAAVARSQRNVTGSR